MGNAAKDNFRLAGDRIDPCPPRHMESSLYFSSGLLVWRVPRGKKGKLYYVLSKEKEQTVYVDRGKIQVRIEHLAEGVTLYLGDCREIIPTLARGYTVISDPPYGVSARSGMGGGTKGNGGMWAGATIAGDKDVSTRDDALALAQAPFAVLAAVRLPHPPGTKATVVWDKGEHTGAGDLRLPWKPNFDLVHIGGDGWRHTRRGSGIIKFNAVAGCVGNRNDGKRFHPFEKPVALMAHFVERAPSNIIIDPFCGGCATGVAAIKLGRSFIGIDSDPEFFDIGCRRLADEISRPEMMPYRNAFDEPSVVKPFGESS